MDFSRVEQDRGRFGDHESSVVRLAWLLAGLVLIHVALATLYSFETPWRTPGSSNGLYLPDIGAPDERAHANYVQHLLSGEGLPIFEGGKSPENYENHQGPLFYVIDAALGRAAGLREISSTFAGRVLRALNTLVGATTVLGVFFLCLWSTGKQDLALFATGTVSLLPALCAADGAVNNDPLLIALCTWSVALYCHGRRAGWNRLVLLANAVVIGLACLTKNTAVVLLPCFALALFFRSEVKVPATRAAGAILLSLLVASPFWVRNFTLYGDPLGMAAFNRSWAPDVHLGDLVHPHAVAHWLYVLVGGVAESGVGEFGYMDIHLPNAFYALWLMVFFLLLVAGFKSNAWRVVDAGTRTTLIAFAVLVIAAFVSYNLRYVQPQARFVFPALGVAALLMACGLKRIARDRFAICSMVILVGMLLTNAYALKMLPAEFSIRTQRMHGTAGPNKP